MFSQESSNQGQSQFQLIPENTIASALIVIRDVKTSDAGKRLDCEFVLQTGPHAGRKVWQALWDAWRPQGGMSDEQKKMQARTIGETTRIIESTGGITFGDDDSYQSWVESNIETLGEFIQGKEIAIRIGIQKGKNGYEDKNVIREFGSPAPKSNGLPLFQQVQQGLEVFEKNWGIQRGDATPQPKPSAAKPVPAKAAAASPAWLKKQ